MWKFSKKLKREQGRKNLSIVKFLAILATFLYEGERKNCLSSSGALVFISSLTPVIGQLEN